MKFLLDSHVWIWIHAERERISETLQAQLESADLVADDAGDGGRAGADVRGAGPVGGEITTGSRQLRSEWPVERLGDHLTFLTSGSRGWGQHVRPVGAMFLRIQNVGRNALDLADVAFVQPPSGAEAARTRVRAGDVLLSITADLGRTAVVPAELPAAHINQHLAILRLGPAFHPAYVASYLALGPGREQIDRLNRVGVKAGINFDDIRSLRIPLPPLAEQRRIADILDKADAIRRKRREAMALTDQLLRSAFLEMFGDRVFQLTEHALPAGWSRVTLDDLKAPIPYACVGGPFGSNLTSQDYLDSGVPVIRGTNLGGKANTFIDDGFVYVSEAKARTLVQNMAYPGDLIFTQRGTLGQVAYVPTDAHFPRYVISQSQMKLSPNEARVNPRFLFRFMTSEPVQKHILSHALTTGVPHINLGILRKLPVVLPPRALQDRYAALDAGVTSNQPVLQEAERSAELLFRSLVAHAFRNGVADIPDQMRQRQPGSEPRQEKA